ncbi:MAG: hypothetical protein RL653_2718 [Pseudomonadota bacterium]|jgi:hypothetical protein
MNQKAVRAGAAVGAVALALGAWWLLASGGDRPSSVERPAESARAVEPSGGERAERVKAAAKIAEVPPAAARTVQDAGSPAAWTAGWGAGPGQLGRVREAEGNAEGPMSLAVDLRGGAWVVDTVNGRLQRFHGDGGTGESQPLAVQYAQDVEVLADGRTLQLDRLVDKVVAVVSPEGKVLGELPLEGKGVPEAGGVTGLFVDGEDVYVEREHGALVRVGDTSGRRDESRPEVPGRPSADGSAWLSAGITDPAAGRLYVTSIQREPLQQRFTRELRVPPTVLRLLFLDSDAAGVVYLALVSDAGGEGPVVTLLCLHGGDGHVLGERALPASTLPEESFRDFAVDRAAGGVLYAWRTEAGVQLLRADCR